MKSVLFAMLLVGACVGFTRPASGQQAGTTPFPVGGTIRPPTKTKDVPPVYPPEAQQARATGAVILEAVIGEDGKVRSSRVLRSIPLLDQAAISAVQQWEYTPTLINGVAVPIVMTVTVNFAMQGAPASAVPPLPPPLPNTLRLLANRGPNGQPQVWDIDVMKAASMPRWNQDAEPPVSLAEAARLARNWLNARNPQAERFVLQSTSLLRRPLPMNVEFWFYQIAYATSSITSAPSPTSLVVVLLDGSVLEPKEVSSPAAQTPDPRSVPIPPGVTTPRAIQEVKPTYTPEALRQRISGSVFIQGIVGVDGVFRNLQVVRSLDAVYGLDDAALKAASQWRFVPGMKDGQPVPVAMTIEITFSVR